jgi:hypothetical protein
VYLRGESVDLGLSVSKLAPGAAAAATFSLACESSGAVLELGADTNLAAAGDRAGGTYVLHTDDLRPDRYTLSATVTAAGAAAATASVALEIVGGEPLTDFRILHLGSIPPWVLPDGDWIESSRRYGFNYVMANICDSWGRGKAGYELVRHEQTPEALLRAGFRYMKYPTGYGWGLAHRPIRGGASWYDPEIVSISAQLMQYHAQGARRNPAWEGLNPIDEPGVSWSDPFMADAFTARTGLAVPDEKSGRAEDLERHVAYQHFRNHAMHEFNTRMRDAMREVAPDALFTVQTFADILTHAGLYPAGNACFDVQSTHIYDHWPTSNNWMAFAVNLRRANRPVFWEKPLYVVTGCYGIQPDQWRAAWALGMSEKLDGHGYFLGAGELPEDQPWGEYNLAEQVRLNRLCERYGNFFLALRKPVPPVAVWYSLAQSAAADPARQYEQEPVAAFHALKRVHVPVGVVTDEDLRAGLLREHKVLVLAGMDYLPADLRAAVEAFQRRGGRVVGDRATALELKGLIRLETDFREFAAAWAELSRAWREGRMPTSLRLRRDLDAEAGVLRDLPEVERVFAPLVRRPATAGSPHTFLALQEREEAQYLFVANEAAVFRHPNEKGRWITMQESVPASDVITLADARGRAVYDLWSGERLEPDRDGRLRLDLPAAGLRVLCLLPRPLREPQLELRERDGALEIAARPARGNAGVVPALCELRSPDGRVAFRKYVALDLGDGRRNRWTYRRARTDPPGTWRAELHNLLSGVVHTAELACAPLPPAPQPALARRPPALVFDAAQYAAFARRPGLVVVPGTGAEAAASELAAALGCEVRSADDLRRPDTFPEFLDPEKNKGVWMMPRWQPLALTVGCDVILLGLPATNPLLADLGASGMLPRVPDPALLAPGEALVQYCWSPFDLDRDAVVIAAADPAGLAAGCAGFLPAAARTGPLTAAAGSTVDWGTPLAVAAGAPPRADADTSTGTGTGMGTGMGTGIGAVPGMVPARTLRLRDGIHEVAAGGGLVAAGGLDARLSVFDDRGERLWERAFDYRVTGVAVSPDGGLVLAHAFPRTYVFDRAGQLLHLFCEAEPSLDDVEGLAARAADAAADPAAPALYAGTWTGIVTARAADGTRLWRYPAVPPSDAERKKLEADGKPVPVPPPALAPVREIVPLAGGEVAVGSMKELVFFDAAGTETGRLAVDRLQDLAAAGPHLAVGSFKKKLLLVDSAGQKLWEAATPDFIMAVAADAGGERIAVALFGGRVQLYDAAGKLLLEGELPGQPTLTGAAFTAAGDALWLGTWDGDLLLWRLPLAVP